MGRRFLIGQLGHYGDCLYATTIARQIKHDFPDSVVTWAIAAKFKSILLHNPYVDHPWIIQTNTPHEEAWDEFVEEARRRKNNGEFDEIIFSQLNPHNGLNFNGTLRGSALSHYKRPITVSVRGVIRLSDDEVNNVRQFAQKNALQSFRKVVLFECNPASGQSDVNIEFAAALARKVNALHADTCFVLSSTQRLSFSDPRIIDGSSLSFRENAELTKYCTMLIGCSSGITWLSTSDWAKRLPMVQLLRKAGLYYGVAYDHQLWNLDHSSIIEMTTWNEENVFQCVQTILNHSFATAKERFHQHHQPGLGTFANGFRAVVLGRYTIRTTLQFMQNYYQRNRYLSLAGLFLVTIGIVILSPIRKLIEQSFPRDSARRESLKRGLHLIGLSRFLSLAGQDWVFKPDK